MFSTVKVDKDFGVQTSRQSWWGKAAGLRARFVRISLLRVCLYRDFVLTYSTFRSPSTFASWQHLPPFPRRGHLLNALARRTGGRGDVVAASAKPFWQRPRPSPSQSIARVINEGGRRVSGLRTVATQFEFLAEFLPRRRQA